MPDAKQFQLNLPLIPKMPQPDPQSLPWLVFSWAFWKTFFHTHSNEKLHEFYDKGAILNSMVTGSRIDRLSAERQLGINCICSWPEWLRVETENFNEEFKIFCMKPRARIAIAIVDMLGKQSIYLEELDNVRKSVCGSARELKTLANMILPKDQRKPVLEVRKN